MPGRDDHAGPGDGRGPDRAEWLILLLWLVFIGLFLIGTPPLLRACVGALAGILTGIRYLVVERHPNAFRPHGDQVYAARDLPQPADRVWALIYPAENAPLTDPSIARGYRVPGTPAGVGERQAFVRFSGETTVIEVIEFEPGRRAVTVALDEREQPSPQLRLTFEVDPTARGCTLTTRLQAVPGSGVVLPGRRQLRRELRRVAIALRKWDGRPPDPS